jgi:hypothetical protein
MRQIANISSHINRQNWRNEYAMPMSRIEDINKG